MKRNHHTGRRRQEGCGLGLFTGEECEDVHLATLEVLQQTGIYVEDDTARALYAEGGCDTSDMRGVVKIPADVVEAAGVRMDVERHEVWVDGRDVRLALKEFELLEMLLRNSGRVLTRGQLIDRIWGADYVGDTKTLDVHVKRLRSKIEDDPAHPARLMTVRGLGYKFAS